MGGLFLLTSRPIHWPTVLTDTMARRKRPPSTHRRDLSRVANRVPEAFSASPDAVVDLKPLRLRFSPLVRSRPSTDVEDHRRHQPDHWHVPRTISGRRAHVHLPKVKKPATRSVGRLHRLARLSIATVNQQLKFRSPKHVQLCVRREQRREVLLAKGRGGGRHRRPKRNRFSNVRC